MSKKSVSYWALLAALCVVASVFCQHVTAQGKGAPPTAPDHYLLLMRDSIVHELLRVSDEQRQTIRRLTDELDGPFMAIRGQSIEEGTKNLRALIADAKSRMKSILTAEQQKRLSQIILRAQGVRGLLRDDIGQQLQFSTEQATRIRKIISAAEKAFQLLRGELRNGADQASIENRIVDLRTKEQKDIVAVLSDAQKKGWIELLGPSFDTSRLGRVAYKAPEVSFSDLWINSSPLSMAGLRGKVVALHFFAYG